MSSVHRFLHNTLTSYVFSPTIIAPILLNLRTTIFPNNSLGPPAPPPPSPEDQLIIRRRAAQALLDLIPPFVARTYYNTNDVELILESVENDVLDAFGDRYLNKHLIYRILEVILVRLIPELGQKGVGELLEERGVLWGVESNHEETVEVKVEMDEKKVEKERNIGKKI